MHGLLIGYYDEGLHVVMYVTAEFHDSGFIETYRLLRTVSEEFQIKGSGFGEGIHVMLGIVLVGKVHRRALRDHQNMGMEASALLDHVPLHGRF